MSGKTLPAIEATAGTKGVDLKVCSTEDMEERLEWRVYDGKGNAQCSPSPDPDQASLKPISTSTNTSSGLWSWHSLPL